jgi:hypothetical protein
VLTLLGKLAKLEATRGINFVRDKENCVTN